MTLVSNDPSWWPSIDSYRTGSYLIVAASVVMTYDWALTFAQEVELIWRQRWSIMTVLYLSVRYIGLSYAVINILLDVPTISVTDVGCLMMYLAQVWTNAIVTAIVGVIMIFRLNAMYQRSRKVLILLVVIFLAVNITNGVMFAITSGKFSGEELILSGTYQCAIDLKGDLLLILVSWILGTIWEVVALCLAGCIAVKHFRELQRLLGGGIIGDCFTVLLKTHVVYFASFVAVSCFELSYIVSTISADEYSLETQIYLGFSRIFMVMRLFILGPRLILSVREYHAKLVADSDVATALTSIAFQERVHVSTSSSV